jgi:hypothetical protein
VVVLVLLLVVLVLHRSSVDLGFGFPFATTLTTEKINARPHEGKTTRRSTSRQRETGS